MMHRAPAAFRQRDVKRALRACVAAGVKAQRVEIDPTTGKIVVILEDAESAPIEQAALDAWRSSRGAR